MLRMRTTRHPGVDAYIAALPEWQAAVCRELREIVHLADPEIEEAIKRTVQPYFVCHGNVCALLAAKTHVNLFIYDPRVPDPDCLINQGHGNATARAIQVHQGERINGQALAALLRAVAARNRQGGWRKIVDT